MDDTASPQESIYNYLIEQVDPEKAPRYTSKFRPKINMQAKLIKNTMKTMGPAKVDVPSPDKYLKKHSKEAQLPESEFSNRYKRLSCLTYCPTNSCPAEKEGCRRTCTAKKPPIPSRTEHPPMGIHTQRNFMKTTTAAPMKPQPASVDTNRGHKELLEHSGLIPKYIKKKDYGQVPEYLQQRSEEKQINVEKYNRYLKEQMELGAMKQLSDEERQLNLQSLKRTWAELHQEYQRLPLFIDTLLRKTRKERLEAEMQQLEGDIALFEKFKTIYIAK
ncbi:enkurin isoform X1 [Dunckerocampus dactyliophorus]|uniref:enkurin isoform X1 n=1 Tax=Dunckerocampus dactyliophorus TaxID=161453 RepID=UPI002406A94A|nr:enkurin isoform X1 [Dunckerocampus dactyliophorus]